MWASLVALWQLLCLPLTYLSLTPTALVLAILSVGPLPKHVAFIMDGNRRWARTLTPEAVAGYSNGSTDGEVAQKTISGHQSGFQALKRVLDLCLQLGRIEHVTVYAFAIDNFKRKQSEVDELMALARQSLVELAGHGELLARYSARLKVVGRKEMLPVDVQEAVQRVEDLTKNNRGPTLNICIPYSSRDEMAGAIRARTQAHLDSMAAAERNGHLSNGNGHGHVNSNSDDAELALLEKEMQLAHSPPVDIMVRTSGVHRLSDFMLWQVSAHEPW